MGPRFRHVVAAALAAFNGKRRLCHFGADFLGLAIDRAFEPGTRRKFDHLRSGNRNRLAGPKIAPLALAPLLYLESSEARELDILALLHRSGHCVTDGL